MPLILSLLLSKYVKSGINVSTPLCALIGTFTPVFTMYMSSLYDRT
ncbi:hypothetical protein [Mycoplasmopsis cynos]|nr:hypothetical protein [Mycoplasmopsis cynos]WAM10867.1 hypothetical protein ONA00_06290 [Mycoplasmopsis cynos]